MTDIVVGVDGSDSASQALVWAAREGGLHGWPVTAVLAYGLLDQHHVSADEAFDPTYGEMEALGALDAYVVRVLGSTLATRIQRRAVCDLAAPALLGACSPSSLLVLGSRGLGGFRGLLLGSVSERCLHQAPCPVAIVRDSPPPIDGHAPERILVGIDGSQQGQRALEWAVQEARARRAALEVLHAWHPPYIGSMYSAVSFDPRLLEDAARSVLDDAIKAVDTSGLEQPVERLLWTGGAAWTVLEAAKGADLIVLGSHGRSAVTGVILGSVSHQVAHHASCPVVIVRSAS